MSDCPECGAKLPKLLPFVRPQCMTCGWKRPRRTWADIKTSWQRRKS